MSETQSQIKQPLFALGRLVATPGALEVLTRSEQTPLEFLSRHSRGDWGECCSEDATENDSSVKAGFRIFSVYPCAMAASPARAEFKILGKSELRKLNRMVRRTASHAARGVLYAEAGLLDEAEKEFQTHLELRPADERVKRLLRIVQSWRP